MGNQYYKPGDEKVDVSVGDEEQRNLSRRSTAASDGFAPDMGMPGRHRLRDSRRSPRDRITGSEIRLLKLRPGKPGEDLEGNIEVFSLLRSPGKVEKGSVKDADDGTGIHTPNDSRSAEWTKNPPSYEALSYNWGDPRIVGKIKIIEGGEVYEIGIRQNLMAALRILRHAPRLEHEHDNDQQLRDSARKELKKHPGSLRLFEALTDLIKKSPEAALKHLKVMLWDFPDKYLDDLMDVITDYIRTGSPPKDRAAANFYQMINADWIANEPPAYRYLWIDAICIDQDDNEEKSRQIPRMLDIYMQAKEVCVWLGEELTGTKSAEAMDFVDRVLKRWESGIPIMDLKLETEWDAFITLLRRPWFSRRWIVQEITRAQNASVYCGNKTVSWKNFADVVSLFKEHQAPIQTMFKRSVTLGNDPERMGDLDELSAIRLVHASDHLFRRDVEEGVSEKLLPLEGLISTLTAFEAAEPKDTIYAVIWLARDATPVSKRAFRSYQPNLHPSTSTSTSTSTSKAFGDAEGFGEIISAEPQALDRGRAGAASEDTQAKTNGAGEPAESTGNTTTGQAKDSTQVAKRNAEAMPEDDEKTPTDGIDIPLPRDSRYYFERFMTMLNYKRFIVDYEKTLFEVCYDFMRFCANNSKRIDLICRPWAPEPNEKELENYGQLPSWIRRLSAHGIFSHSQGGPIERINADPLVGRPGTGEKRFYNADRGVQVTFKTNWKDQTDSTDRQAWMNIEIPPGRVDQVREDKRHLVVDGFVLDQIGHVHPAARGGNVPVEWLSAVKWTEPGTEPPDDFWRTLVGNRDRKGDRAPYLWKRACQQAFKRRVSGGDLNVRRQFVTSDVSDTINREFLKRVEHVVFRRSLLELKYEKMWLNAKRSAREPSLSDPQAPSPPPNLARDDNRRRTTTVAGGAGHSSPRPLKRAQTIMEKTRRVAMPAPSSQEPVRSTLALGPCDAKSGDIIAIIFGCCVPVVLRKVGADMSEASPWSWKEENFEYTIPGGPNPSADEDAEGKAERKIEKEGKERFLLIGECYMHGKMDGEAFKVPNIFREFRKFTIV